MYGYSCDSLGIDAVVRTDSLNGAWGSARTTSVSLPERIEGSLQAFLAGDDVLEVLDVDL
jgi:hypothetical protein